jgi:signal transduction histidine kinase
MDRAIIPPQSDSLPLISLTRSWQLDLLRRFLGLAAVLGAFLTAHELFGHASPALGLSQTLLGLLGLGFLWWRPQRRAWVAGLFFAGTLGLLALSAVNAHNAAVPALCFSLLPTLLATLLQGPRLGLGVGLATLALLGGLGGLYPPLSRTDALRLVAEGLSVAVGFLVAWRVDLGFHGLQRALEARAETLTQFREQRQRLASALFDGLHPLLQGLRQSLEQPDDEALPRARESAKALFGRLRDARALAGHEPEPAMPGGQARSWFGAEQPWAWVLAQLLLGALLFWRFRVEGGGPDAPVLILLPLLTLLAVVSNGLWLTLGATFFSGALLFMAATAPSLASPELSPLLDLVAATGQRSQAQWVSGELSLLFNLALLQAVVALAAFSVLELRRSYLERLRAEGEALSATLKLRRRLAGTLFHDVSNQVMALHMAFEMAKEPAKALERGRRLGTRIERLMAASHELLFSDGSLPPANLQPVPVDLLFKEMLELFESTLKNKGQVLSLSAPPGLVLRAALETVSDSVLGNLVSNAIKFSPPGSVIELSARAEGGQVLLCVRDSGPGLAPELLAALAVDWPLQSRLGTAGEQGQGFGLLLVAEHLRRQQGRLVLLPGPQGGTEAQAWLPQA